MPAWVNNCGLPRIPFFGFSYNTIEMYNNVLLESCYDIHNKSIYFYLKDDYAQHRAVPEDHLPF